MGKDPNHEEESRQGEFYPAPLKITKSNTSSPAARSQGSNSNSGQSPRVRQTPDEGDWIARNPAPRRSYRQVPGVASGMQSMQESKTTQVSPFLAHISAPCVAVGSVGSVGSVGGVGDSQKDAGQGFWNDKEYLGGLCEVSKSDAGDLSELRTKHAGDVRVPSESNAHLIDDRSSEHANDDMERMSEPRNIMATDLSLLFSAIEKLQATIVANEAPAVMTGAAEHEAATKSRKRHSKHLSRTLSLENTSKVVGLGISRVGLDEDEDVTNEQLDTLAPLTNFRARGNPSFAGGESPARPPRRNRHDISHLVVNPVSQEEASVHPALRSQPYFKDNSNAKSPDAVTSKPVSVKHRSQIVQDIQSGKVRLSPMPSVAMVNPHHQQIGSQNSTILNKRFPHDPRFAAPPIPSKSPLRPSFPAIKSEKKTSTSSQDSSIMSGSPSPFKRLYSHRKKPETTVPGISTSHHQLVDANKSSESPESMTTSTGSPIEKVNESNIVESPCLPVSPAKLSFAKKREYFNQLGDDDNERHISASCESSKASKVLGTNVEFDTPRTPSRLQTHDHTTRPSAQLQRIQTGESGSPSLKPSVELGSSKPKNKKQYGRFRAYLESKLPPEEEEAALKSSKAHGVSGRTAMFMDPFAVSAVSIAPATPKSSASQSSKTFAIKSVRGSTDGVTLSDRSLQSSSDAATLPGTPDRQIPSATFMGNDSAFSTARNSERTMSPMTPSTRSSKSSTDGKVIAERLRGLLPPLPADIFEPAMSGIGVNKDSESKEMVSSSVHDAVTENAASSMENLAGEEITFPKSSETFVPPSGVFESLKDASAFKPGSSLTPIAENPSSTSPSAQENDAGQVTDKFAADVSNYENTDPDITVSSNLPTEIADVEAEADPMTAEDDVQATGAAEEDEATKAVKTITIQDNSAGEKEVPKIESKQSGEGAPICQSTPRHLQTQSVAVGNSPLTPLEDITFGLLSRISAENDHHRRTRLNDFSQSLMEVASATRRAQQHEHRAYEYAQRAETAAIRARSAAGEAGVSVEYYQHCMDVVRNLLGRE